MNRDRSVDDAHNLLYIAKFLQSKHGDSGEMIVGEWGVTGADGPDQLSHLYSVIIQSSISQSQKSLPSVMFYLSHSVVDERAQGVGIWGVRWFSWDSFQGVVRYQLNPYTSSTPDQQAL